ncbi:thiamine biosynthesis lipoprotein apbE [Asticcacaulis biprosthecium C19]|uniref:FAD:protein FMN transferase n=1 Tax=Asticcacaulis biprosthecium C19 TaxID=715226 RepID=F4QN54_9CAUL|nr:FAD:protein FMN transferase [Asticcacaulis biprosthecium]EGF91645.1 thiamine biosynthesis lipoprotein apbE [Asticcacaulis biprosthecium C19]
MKPESVSGRKVLIPPLGGMPRPHPTARKYVLEGEAFATAWKVILLADPGLSERAFAHLNKRLETKLDQVDREMSPYRADSDLTRFNTAEPGSFVELPPMFTVVMGHALDTARLSGGAFDPCLLDAVEAWGFGAKAVPDGLADVSGLSGGGWRQLTWQADGMVRPQGVRIDLCAIAKGFAANELLRLVKAEPGCVAALVEVGGELTGWGVQPDGLPWWVEIEGADAVIALHEMAVATSGDSRRFFVHNGKVMSHTIDAKTCAPTASNITGATVLDPACWRADALATALMVMGEAKALDFATRQNIACLLRVRDGDSVREVLSPALEAWL